MNWKILNQIIRHIRNNKLFSFINIIGLGVGLGCTLLMGIHILHEFSFDKYHKNSEQLYRVVIDKSASTPYAMRNALKENVPGIIDIFRVYDIWNVKAKLNNEFVKEDDFILADEEIFSILDIPLLLGDKNQLFDNRSTLVISEIISEKYFPNENPIGNNIEISISGRIVNFTITGVFRHFPSNSSLQAKWIGNLEEAFPVMANVSDFFQKIPEKELMQLKQDWGKNGFQTIVLTNINADVTEAEKQSSQILSEHRKKKHRITFQPYGKMYFHSENMSNLGPFITNQLSSLKIYAGIAILILLIACINYVLLSLSDAKKQLKQVACRKINGASSYQIQKQYILQSLFTSFLSLIPALLFLLVIIPFFNQLFDKNLSIELFLRTPYLLMLFAFVLFTGLIAGTYISFYAARLNPLQLLSPDIKQTKNTSFEKGILVTTQFIIFLLLASSTFIMEKQMSFLMNKNQGFNTDNVLVFRLDNMDAQRQSSVIKAHIQQNPHVKMIAESVLTPPTQDFWQFTVEKSDKDIIDEEGLYVGANLLRTLQIPITEGEDFSLNDNVSDTRKLIVNEAAAKKYNLKAGEFYGKTFIKAVVADFHAHSLHRTIKPLLLFYSNSDNITELVVRTDGNTAEVIEHVRSFWKKILPTSFLEYEVLNDRISAFYKKEEKQTKSVMFFASMAVLLAALGLFGYVSLTLLQRTKEIGIRKVNGARISELMIMLNKDFIKWVAIAFVIACPIAYYAMHKWLENFAYKTNLSWWIFALAGLLALGIALLTVSWQSWRAATQNPIEALRYE